MSLIGTLAWVALGMAATGVLVAFWDEIKQWLNNTAANAIEKVFGYNARNLMQRAVAKVDRIMDKVRITSTIYTKKDPLSTTFEVIDITAETEAHTLDPKVLEEIQKKGVLTQEFIFQ